MQPPDEHPDSPVVPPQPARPKAPPLPLNVPDAPVVTPISAGAQPYVSRHIPDGAPTLAPHRPDGTPTMAAPRGLSKLYQQTKEHLQIYLAVGTVVVLLLTIGGTLRFVLARKAQTTLPRTALSTVIPATATNTPTPFPTPDVFDPNIPYTTQAPGCGTTAQYWSGSASDVQCTPSGTTIQAKYHGGVGLILGNSSFLAGTFNIDLHIKGFQSIDCLDFQINNIKSIPANITDEDYQICGNGYVDISQTKSGSHVVLIDIPIAVPSEFDFGVNQTQSATEILINHQSVTSQPVKNTAFANSLGLTIDVSNAFGSDPSTSVVTLSNFSYTPML